MIILLLRVHVFSVLFLLEVMHGASGGAATLVLTSEALFVVSGEEDVQEAVFRVSELDCLSDGDDPTRLVLAVRPPGHSSAHPFEARSTVKDRITQFVLETGAMTQHCTVSDVEGEPAEESESSSTDKEPKKPQLQRLLTSEEERRAQEYVFFASPLMRTAFLGVFQMVRRQICHKGFGIL